MLHNFLIPYMTSVMTAGNRNDLRRLAGESVVLEEKSDLVECLNRKGEKRESVWTTSFRTATGVTRFSKHCSEPAQCARLSRHSVAERQGSHGRPEPLDILCDGLFALVGPAGVSRYPDSPHQPRSISV